MHKDQRANNIKQPDDDFSSVFEEMTRIKNDIAVKKLAFYIRRGNRVRFLFRLSGILIIGFSVIIPFLATLHGFWISIVLPIIAILIAGLTGLTSFFRWEADWREIVRARNIIDYKIRAWELKILEAKHENDTRRGMALAFQATQELLRDVYEIQTLESESYFKHVKIPNTHTS